MPVGFLQKRKGFCIVTKGDSAPGYVYNLFFNPHSTMISVEQSRGVNTFLLRDSDKTHCNNENRKEKKQVEGRREFLHYCENSRKTRIFLLVPVHRKSGARVASQQDETKWKRNFVALLSGPVPIS